MRNTLEQEKRRGGGIQRGLALLACILVMFFLHTPLFAQQKTGDDKDASSKKMNVSRYDENARGISAPMYDYYAQKIKEKTGITNGTCLDVGAGGGYMGLALAKITDLNFVFLDISEEMLEKAKRHIIEDGLQKRAKTLLADVHSIPLPDGSINLVISRGSIPFWKDPAQALKEIYRVLAPGGKAYVGGGKGTPEIQAQIAAKRKALGMESSNGPKFDKGPRKIPQRDYEQILKESGIANCSINRGDDGMWIEMWK